MRRYAQAPVTLLAVLSSLASCASPRARPPAPTTVVTVPSASPRLPLSVDPPPPPAPQVDFLADGYSATTARRAWLARRGPLRFSKSGELLHSGAAESIRAVSAVVVAESDSVRLLLEMRDVRLLVYADRSALAPVACAATMLSLGHDRPPNAATGVKIAPSLLLVEKERTDGTVHVEGSTSDLTFDGWLPAASLCVTHDQGELPAVAGNGLVRERARVVASPGGDVVATFGDFGSKAPEYRFRVEHEGLGPPGYQVIRFRTREVEVRGLVASSDYKPLPSGHGPLHGSHRSRAPGGAMSDSRVGTLREGTPLFAPGTQERIGRVLHPMRIYYGLAPSEGEALVPVSFFAEELGLVTMRAREGDIQPTP